MRGPVADASCAARLWSCRRKAATPIGCCARSTRRRRWARRFLRDRAACSRRRRRARCGPRRGGGGSARAGLRLAPRRHRRGDARARHLREDAAGAARPRRGLGRRGARHGGRPAAEARADHAACGAGLSDLLPRRAQLVDRPEPFRPAGRARGAAPSRMGLGDSRQRHWYADYMLDLVEATAAPTRPRSA